jgi:ribosome-interacting GTPase 1
MGKKIILFNKTDLLNENERRKIEARLQSKRYNFCLISCTTLDGFDNLKRKLIENSGVIRAYTKQPGKPKDEDPVIMKPDSTVEELAKKVFHSSIKIKETRITGPSSKFPNQTVGLKHILKDKDIVEFHT